MQLRFCGFGRAARLVCVASLAHVDLLSRAFAADDRWGWAYCPPPYPPACAQSPAKKPAKSDPCEQAVDAYVAAVFRYRACLAQEMERAVREANRTVEIVKCPKDKRYCYGLKP
jgi:hypothetical protein